MASFEQKTKYYLWCNNESLPRYTGFRTDSEGEPTQCPVCSSANIQNISVHQKVNPGRKDNVNENEYATTSTTQVTRVSVVESSPAVGDKFEVEWYCELYKSSTGDAEIEVTVSGTGTGTVSIGAGTQASIGSWLPIYGKDIFEVTVSESLTFALKFATAQNAKEVKIRKARLWIEHLPEGS